jgi:hypothetical protein
MKKYEGSCEDWIHSLKDACTSCDKKFWADLSNLRKNGWVCDECLIIEKLEEDDENA